jgi:hypothetical protein
MTYVCSTWEFAADTHLLKPQRLQKNVLLTTAKFPKCTTVRELHMALQIPYIYDYITKLWRQQTEVIQNNEKSKSDTENVRNFSLVAVKHTTVQVTRKPF